MKSKPAHSANAKYSDNPPALAQQIAELDDVQPIEFDPEEEFPDRQSANDDGSDDGNDVSKAAREHYLDVGPSALRKINIDLDVSDAKYNGVKTSRRQLLEDDTNGNVDADHDPTSDEESEHATNDGSDSESSSDNDGKAARNEDDEPSRSSSEFAYRSPSLQEHDLTSALQASRLADRQKGKAISRQMRFWDTLVDARIKLQKAATSTNVLPPPSMTESYQASSSRVSTLVDSVLREGLDLSEDLFTLQEAFSNGQGITLPSRKRRKLDEGDFSQQVLAATEAFSTLEASLHPHHLLTLQKWSLKVQSVAPTALLPSKRTSFRQQNAAPKSAVDMIAEGLEEGSVGRAKAVGRTRVRRGQVQARLGVGAGGSIDVGDDASSDANKSGAHEGDAEVFDDTDFYQEILRDVIHAKSGNLGVDAWEAARPKKIKKVVDTKASKGRKLRYEVHEKLQNFMVPVTPRGAWHDEQIDELFSSLMGKGFSTSSVPEIAAHDNIGDPPEVDLGGLRVF